MIVFFIISVIGLAASMAAHFSTFFGVNPQRVFPPIWVLHVLIFVVWVPVVLYGRKACSRGGGKDFWKAAMGNAKGWMKGLTSCLFVYAFFNFFFTIFVLSEGGVPSEIDGKKVLHSHGKVIRELTDEEYELQQAYTVRTFSGHWMIFYSAGMTVLYSKMKDKTKPETEEEWLEEYEAK